MRSLLRVTACLGLGLVWPAIVLAQSGTVYQAPWNQIGATVTLSASSSSSRAQLGWVAVGASPPPSSVWVHNSSTTVDAYVKLGDSTIVATTSDVLVAAGGDVLLQIPNASATNIAGITASSTASLSIATGVGSPLAKGGGSGGGVASVTGAGTVICSPTTGAVTCTGGASASSMLTTGTNSTSAAAQNIFTNAGAAALTYGGAVSAPSLALTDNTGSGFVDLIEQTSAVANPPADTLRIFSTNGTESVAIKTSAGNVAFLGVNLLSSGRIFTFPDVSGTLVTTGDIGTVTNAMLANPATTVNGQTCTLGSTCTVTAAATSVTAGTTTIGSGTDKGLLYDNAGVLGNLATGNNGVLVTGGTGIPSISSTLPSGMAATSMLLTTPALGVATATSINKVALTAPASSATLTIADGKTLTDTSGLGAVALKGATGGGFAQAACADLSNGATGCSTATGTSGATLPLLNGTNTWSGVQTFGSVVGTATTQSGTGSSAYTFAATDCGTLVLATGASPATYTVPNNLPAVCNIAVSQETSGGQVTIAAGAGVTFNANPHGFTKTFGQYAIIGVTVKSNAGSAAVITVLGDGA
jgi:hypothetical protein